MKQFLFILLVCLLPGFAVAQQASMKIFANSAEQEGEVDIPEYRRMTILVEDGARRDGSVVYEFGDLKVYQVDAEGNRKFIKILQKSDVMNMPTLNFGLSPQQNPDMLGHYELEVDWVKRYNADKTVDDLQFEDAQRKFQIHIHDN